MDRILYVILVNGQEDIEPATNASILANMDNKDQLTTRSIKDRELYYNLCVNDIYTYVCIIPNGSVLNSNARQMFSEYRNETIEKEEKVVYLPFVMYNTSERPVVFNKHMWNSMAAAEAGVLDMDLALKQVDSTIFGAYIPTEVLLDKEAYDDEIKYYQQYHMLNYFVDKHIVLGIPKLTCEIKNWDFELKELDNETKLKDFNLARKKWLEPAEKETSTVNQD